MASARLTESPNNDLFDCKRKSGINTFKENQVSKQLIEFYIKIINYSNHNCIF